MILEKNKNIFIYQDESNKWLNVTRSSQQSASSENIFNRPCYIIYASSINI